MLNHTNLIETLPINVVNRAIARANYDAAEASIDRIVCALAWLRKCGSIANPYSGESGDVRQRGSGVEFVHTDVEKPAFHRVVPPLHRVSMLAADETVARHKSTPSRAVGRELADSGWANSCGQTDDVQPHGVLDRDARRRHDHFRLRICRLCRT